MQALIPVFEETVLPHLDAAYNLARWLTRNERDAEDIVQEAFLRALRHYRTFRGGDAKPWLLAIVRNTFYTWRKHNRVPEENILLEEDKQPIAEDSSDPEKMLLRETDRQLLRSALQLLPKEFMEVIVLREFEELSYKEIAQVMQVPSGTVMSRLARARKRLLKILLDCQNREAVAEVTVSCKE
ncbi:MAG TPA: sigma-70 family RNA polymerase sigma factor [Pyrinomonadaceae bacterium]|nr:sigma-70 family RNA polymerase sigma factor [Pyrinomonadaceae bacterium]